MTRDLSDSVHSNSETSDRSGQSCEGEPPDTADRTSGSRSPEAFLKAAFAPAETGYISVCGPADSGNWNDDIVVVAVDETSRLVTADRDRYFTVHPRSTEGRGAEDNTVSVVMLPIDFDSSTSSDGKVPEHSFESIDEVHEFLKGALPLEPSAIIDSGHGWHVYFYLTEPLDPIQGKQLLMRYKQHLQSYAKTVGKHLDSVFDLARVMRMPGSVNDKNGDRASTRVVEHHPERRYSPDDFDFLPDVATPSLNHSTSTITPTERDEWVDALPEGDSGIAPIEGWCATLRGAIPGSPEVGRHHTALKVIGEASRAALNGRTDFDRSISEIRMVWEEITDERSDEFDEIVDYVVAQRVGDAGTATEHRPAESGPPWPPLRRVEKSDLPDLPIEYVPEALQNITLGVAAAAQVDPALAFTVAIATLSSATAGGVVASPIPSWPSEPVSVWTVGVADPSERKTAVYSRITTPLRDAAQHVSERDSNQRAACETELLLAKKQHKNALRDDDAALLSEAVQRVATAETDLKNHVGPNFVVQDPTPEALEQLMEQQGGVAFVASDEGTFIENLAGRYSGNAPVLGMVNSAWSGQPIRSARVSRGNTFVDHPVLTISALIQPSVAAKLSAPAFVGTGFVSRLLVVYPNPRAGHRPLDEAVAVNMVTIAQWDELLRRTLSKYWGHNREPERIMFDEQAQEVLIEYQHKTDLKCARRELGGMATWFGKAHGHAVRIAGLFAIAKGLDTVDGDTMRDAVAITDWYAQHMTHLFDIAIEADADLGDQERILRWIERHHDVVTQADGIVTTRQLQRDLVRKSRPMGTREDLDAALGALEQRGYIRAIGSNQAKWEIRPQLFQR